MKATIFENTQFLVVLRPSSERKFWDFVAVTARK